MNLSPHCIFLVCLIVESWGDKCQFPALSGDDQAKQLAISNLQRLDSLRGKTFIALSKEGTFKFQLCDNPESLACTSPGAASVTIEDGKLCTNAGSYDNVDIRGEDNIVTLTFSNGTPYNNSLCGTRNRETIITVYCDVRDKSELTQAQSNISQHCSYAFNLNSLDVCEQHRGLSSGSVYCIIFFTVTGTYLLLGFLYRRIVVRAKGVEQIPNYDTWKGFGSLVADGCDFVCRCGLRQEAKMYHGINDPLGCGESESEERDDRLLPM